MTQHVAIDFSPRVARIVTVESTLRSACVRRVNAVERLPGEDQPAFWHRVRSSLPATIDSLIVNIDGAMTSTRIVSLPFSDPRKIEQTLEFELESIVPYDVAGMSIAWHQAERTPNHSSVLTSITKKDQLRELMEQLSAANLEPRSIVHPGVALVELLPENTENNVAVISLGRTQSHLVVANHVGQPLYVRTLRSGGAGVDRTLAKAFDVSVDDAAKAKETQGLILRTNEEGTDAQRHLSETLVGGLASLITAISTTLKSLPSHFAPKHVLLTGGLSRMPGLVDHVQHELGLATQLLDVGQATGSIECNETVAPEYAVAMGLALACTRRGTSLPLNLRRGEFAYSGDFQLYKGEVVRIAVGLAIVLSLGLFSSILRYSLVTAEEDRIDQAFCNTTERIVGRAICDPSAALATMKHNPMADNGVAIPEYSAATLFNMMSKAIDNKIDVTFAHLDFRMDTDVTEGAKISGKGETSSFEATDEIVTALKKDPCVIDANVSKQKKRRNATRVEFNLSVKVNCPQGERPGRSLAEVAATPVAQLTQTQKSTAVTTPRLPTLAPARSAWQKPTPALKPPPTPKASPQAPRVREHSIKNMPEAARRRIPATLKRGSSLMPRFQPKLPKTKQKGGNP